MELVIRIKMDGAAFDENCFEVGRLLRIAAEYGKMFGLKELSRLKLRDINGNICGSVTMEE